MVRIGFVGAGSHAMANLYPALATIDDAQLLAVCDLVEEKARRAAQKYGAQQWFTHVDDMLSEVELDGVCICGDPQMHVEVGIKCLNAGLPIFVEKPSALTSADARRLAETAEKRGLWGMVAYMKRHATCYLVARQIIQGSSFGTVRGLDVKFAHGSYPAVWGIEDPAQAFLIGQVCHMFDLARFLCGEISRVHAWLYRLEDPAVFTYAISLQLDHGAVGTMYFTTSEAWHHLHEWVCVTGDGEFVVVENMQRVRYHQRYDWVEVPGVAVPNQSMCWDPPWTYLRMDQRTGSMVGYTGELRHFVECIKSGEPAAANLWDGYESLRIAEAVWQSAQTGQPVELT